MKSTTVKIRVQGATPEEVAAMAAVMENLFPALIMCKPRKGTNPKYAGNQNYASYSTYRTKGGKPRPVFIPEHFF